MRLIDADVLKESIDGHVTTGEIYPTVEWARGRMQMKLIALKDIDNAPTIEAEPVRRGKYIVTEYDGYADGHPVYCEWKCSVCGCVFEDEEPTYNYCPHCGANMDEEA